MNNLTKAQIEYCKKHIDMLKKVIIVSMDEGNIPLIETLLNSDEFKEYFDSDEEIRDKLEAVLIINVLAQ